MQYNGPLISENCAEMTDAEQIKEIALVLQAVCKRFSDVWSAASGETTITWADWISDGVKTGVIDELNGRLLNEGFSFSNTPNGAQGLRVVFRQQGNS